jgi:indolepyruvate ferredoxin oxidoreductase alpha subunit
MKSRCCCSTRGRTAGSWCAWWSRASRCRRPAEHAGDPAAAHPRLPRARQLRVQGQRRAGDLARNPMENPALRLRALSHPPVHLPHEKLKIESACRPRGASSSSSGSSTKSSAAPRRHRHHRARAACTTGWSAPCSSFGLADAFGDAELPLLVLNVTYPLVPSRSLASARQARRAVVEEGQPEFIEQEINRAAARRHPPHVHGKDVLPVAGEYTGEVICPRPRRFLERHAPELPRGRGRSLVRGECRSARERPPAQLATPLPPRPPHFCIGCPERPVFSALKLAQQANVGPVHISGRHRLPFLRDLRAVRPRPHRSSATA